MKEGLFVSNKMSDELEATGGGSYRHGVRRAFSTRRVLRRMAQDEGGNNMATIKKIAEFQDREEVSAVVKVSKINDVKNFQKRTGGEGSVRNINVEDETGTCRLTLWDEDVDLPENMNIKVGTQLKLTECFTKQTEFGLDVSKGKKGKIELE